MMLKQFLSIRTGHACSSPYPQCLQCVDLDAISGFSELHHQLLHSQVFARITQGAAKKNDPTPKT